MSIMGVGLLRELGDLPGLRCDDVHYPGDSHQTTPRLYEEQDQTFLGHVPGCFVNLSSFMSHKNQAND